MLREITHETAVDAWLRRAEPLPAAQLLPYFEQSLAALWGRALDTLGEVTLAAIVDRVFFSAAERYPFFAGLKVEGPRIRFEALHDHNDLSRECVLQASRFMLVEFLTVLGNLTAEILTPGLHDELAKVFAPPESGRKAEQSRSIIRDEDDGGHEGATS